jgi:hypothetical protein
LLELALFLECSLIPVNVLNFLLLLIMVTILVKYLYNNRIYDMYDNSRFILAFTKYFSLTFFILKYLFQF